MGAVPSRAQSGKGTESTEIHIKKECPRHLGGGAGTFMRSPLKEDKGYCRRAIWVGVTMPPLA